jgi:hypothetical protein
MQFARRTPIQNRPLCCGRMTPPARNLHGRYSGPASRSKHHLNSGLLRAPEVQLREAPRHRRRSALGEGCGKSISKNSSNSMLDPRHDQPASGVAVSAAQDVFESLSVNPACRRTGFGIRAFF